MCDYSLHHVGSRAARVEDRLITTELAKSGSRGFAAVGELGAKLVIDEAPPKVAVCLLPGTELAFDEDVQYDRAFCVFGKARLNHKLARFREIDMDDLHVHHDALEFPDGRILKVTQLVAGQTARVLQLPVANPHPDHHQAEAVGRAARPSEMRLALNRVSESRGMASILMPSQSTVMLWRACRSAAVGFSAALKQSFRRWRAHKQHAAAERALPLPAHGVPIVTSFNNGSYTTKSKAGAAAEKSAKKTAAAT